MSRLVFLGVVALCGYDRYRPPDARPRAEEGLRRADHPVDRRGARPPRLRDQQADRGALRRAAAVPRRLALSRCSTASRSAAGCRAGGWRRPASAGGASTGSPRKGRRVLASQRETWKAFVDGDGSHHGSGPCLSGQAHICQRLAPLRLSPAREAEIVEELSQHLDDRYEELRAAATRRGAASAGAGGAANDTLAREMRALRQARPRRRSSKARRDAASCRTCCRTCATPRACCASSPASRRPPSSRSRSASAPTPRSSAWSTRRSCSGCRSAIPSGSSTCHTRNVGSVFSYSEYAALRDHAVVRRPDRLGWHHRQPERRRLRPSVTGIIVTGNFFDVLGVRPRSAGCSGRRRRDAGRASGGGDQPRLLADALRRPRGHRRARDPPERPPSSRSSA